MFQIIDFLLELLSAHQRQCCILIVTQLGTQDWAKTYALSSWACSPQVSGMHIRQITHAYVMTIHVAMYICMQLICMYVSVAQPDPGPLGPVPYHQLSRPYHHQQSKNQASGFIIKQPRKQMHYSSFNASIPVCMQNTVNLSIHYCDLQNYFRPFSVYKICQNTMAHKMHI